MRFGAVFLAFWFVAFATVKIMVLQDGDTPPEFDIPAFEEPDIEFVDLSTGCAGFIDCTEYLANVVRNIGAGIIYLVLLLVELVFFVGELIVLLLTVSFTGFDGAPWWINLLTTVPLAMSLAFITFKLIRKGDSEA